MSGSERSKSTTLKMVDVKKLVNEALNEISQTDRCMRHAEKIQGSDYNNFRDYIMKLIILIIDPVNSNCYNDENTINKNSL